MHVSVVMSSYNQLAALKLALASLYAQSHSPTEVIVADDGSTDGTLEWLDRQDTPFASFAYVTRPHSGYGLVGVNAMGVAEAHGERILFANADVVYCSDWVKVHSSLHPSVIAGGLICGISRDVAAHVTRDDVMSGRIAKIAKEHPSGKTNHAYLIRDPKHNLYGVWGGNYSVSRLILDRAGGINQGFHQKYGGEEADLIVRGRKCGACVQWVPKAIGWHLDHIQRTYQKRATGNVKYRKEHNL